MRGYVGPRGGFPDDISALGETEDMAKGRCRSIFTMSGPAISVDMMAVKGEGREKRAIVNAVCDCDLGAFSSWVLSDAVQKIGAMTPPVRLFLTLSCATNYTLIRSMISPFLVLIKL